ncbi:uncharacterized protein BJ171DRAFT_581501 [Polychytrium aggregatum]|uniref:uncharacterized protein n=1 Tax=Polychytrium aggregatum TaxID=110093 RepID=UPI0022FE6924|nr:uncharacterized protein BJ171DRAFT_581501 [Polychytrium aggregatum]KAI9204816.1 hypothetical protein BJ171DRAFT_581501 [Polychytrium aggregatum]
MFKAASDAFSQILREAFPKAIISVNPVPPRKGAFEVTLNVGSEEDDIVVYSGLNQRMGKFPSSEATFAAVDQGLMKAYRSKADQ